MEALDLRKIKPENTQALIMEPCDIEYPVAELCDVQYELSQLSPEITSRVTYSDENVTPNDSLLVYSPNDSVVCIDQVNRDAVNSPPISPSHFSHSSSPLACLSNNTEISNNATGNSDPDDDLYIVYEKKAPPSEVQIIDTRSVSNTSTNVSNRGNRSLLQIFPGYEQLFSYRQRASSLTVQNQNNSSANIPVSSNVSSSTTSDSLYNSDDDCITVEAVLPVVTEIRSVSSSITVKRNYVKDDHQLSALEDVENKKKKKIECGVCFDGPDDIANNGRTLISTVCGHIFCSDCIKKAIKSAKQCPQCRKKLTYRQYHPLYI